MLPNTQVSPGRYGNNIYVIRYTPDFYSICATDTGATLFDCFVINLNESLTDIEMHDIAERLAGPCFEWIEIFGFKAEILHDMIDRAAVISGQQQNVGDGYPMTTWNDEAAILDDTLSYIATGGQGTCDWKILLVIGTVRQYHEITSAQSKLK